MQVKGLEFEGIVTDRLKKRAVLLEAADKAGLWLISDDSDEWESDSEYVPYRGASLTSPSSIANELCLRFACSSSCIVS